ncbi:hypothetical protein JTE90_008885 [Oedothorax gibbosus]|uniref:Reverse transcriptase RNase H-like domain-containing protein n=1 Tax=Oedothorax gibbosus TaxID=931172 RepID=A0AAV6TIJ0_9ARAC|nr:hypothetical protein JTE90_008885 [Oedothorax gibbosus]
MFAHHCRWIPGFSDKKRPLLDTKNFPLSEAAVKAIESIKADISKASLSAVEDNIPFRVETDASEHAIAATLSQAGRRHFEVFTDQRSVSFMFDQTHNSKVKNEKIMRWRLDLACYKFDVIYRPGKDNASADALSRISAVVHSETSLSDLHNMLCHPGVTRMYHWVR